MKGSLDISMGMKMINVILCICRIMSGDGEIWELRFDVGPEIKW